MNNFKLPKTSLSEDATARYGNVSTSALIQMMIENGSRIASLEAQIFGGANHPDSSLQKEVGQENIMIAQKILKKRE